MANTSNQKLTVLIPIEDYGWIARYAQQNDMTPSQVIRKAVRVFISANVKKRKDKEASSGTAEPRSGSDG